MAFGELELTPHEYYSMTRAEFILKLKGYQKKEFRKWEHTRQVCYTIASNAMGRKKRLPSVKTWWPLPTDKIQTLDISQAEMKAKWQALKK